MRLNQTYGLFEELSYPLSASEAIEQIGDRTVKVSNGKETVESVLGRLGDAEFTDPMDAHTAFMSALSRKAIGRVAYSDRDAPVDGFAERDPRATNVLLEGEGRFRADGPHCGICEHVSLVGDWDVMAYCNRLDDIIDPVVSGSVCDEYQEIAR